jgi:hypothetical protein
MKTINRIRSTNSFHILCGRANEVATAVTHFGRGLVSLAYDAKADQWTARVTTDKGMDDVLFVFTAIGTVRVLERAVIVNHAETAAAVARLRAAGVQL